MTSTVSRFTVCDRCEGSRAEPGSEGRKTCPTCRGAGAVRAQAQSFFGTVVTNQVCPQCHGLGEVVITPCGKCLGSGRMRVDDEVEVGLPKGIDGGYRLRLTGEGNAGVDGGRSGDLYVYTELEAHPHFTRQGDDLHYRLPLGLVQAALGCAFEVPTMDEPEVLNVPAGTQPGTEFRLRGKGMPRLRQVGTGDLVISAQVEVPKKLSPKARDLLEAYAEEVGERVEAHETLLERVRGFFKKKSRGDDKADRPEDAVEAPG